MIEIRRQPGSARLFESTIGLGLKEVCSEQHRMLGAPEREGWGQIDGCVIGLAVSHRNRDQLPRDRATRRAALEGFEPVGGQGQLRRLWRLNPTCILVMSHRPSVIERMRAANAQPQVGSVDFTAFLEAATGGYGGKQRPD